MCADPERFKQRLIELSAQPVEASDDFVLERPRRRVLRRRVHPVIADGGDWHVVIWQDVTTEKDEIAQRDRQLLVDPLTGIPNRRAAEAAIRDELARARRAGTELCVALFDIDHFKRINDSFGHAAGDRVLERVAQTLASQTRASDTIARWGGEEFVALVAGPIAGARAYCERARRAVEELRLPNGEAVTISAGIAVVTDGDADATLQRADEQLYEAKRAGRNRACG
jgi:diguanylate cyclase (GGDEF)-like protein